MRISDWSSDVCSSDLIRTDAPHLKLMNGTLLLKMVNGAGYSRFVGAADRQFNQSRVTALVKLRRSRGNQRTAISGRILPINPTTYVDRSVIRSLSAPRFPTPGARKSTRLNSSP